MVRFEREAKVLASVDHANVGALYEFREENGTHFLVLQLVEGETLEERIERGPIPEPEAVDLFVQIARALEAAHKKGVIHRDLKPANVKITPEGQVKVLDFGMAKPQEVVRPISPDDPTRLSDPNEITAAGMLLGTPSYMSPEQARGLPVDERTDVWAFGCCLYEALTGQLPFKGESIADAISAVLQLEPDFSQLPNATSASIVNVLKRSLTKESHERIANMSELIDMLHNEREAATRKHGLRMSIPLAAATAGLLIVAGVGTWFSGRPSTPDAPLLEQVAEENQIESIAVLPFKNVMNDPEVEHIVDGMTGAIIRELHKIKSLRVVSRTTSMSYKNNTLPIFEIAQSLNVDAILEGEVTVEGETVEIYGNLVDPENDASLWNDTLEEQFEGVIQLHRNIALTVAEEIDATLTPDERTKLETVEMVDREAMEAYLYGMDLLNRRELPASIPHFQKAIQLAPEFPLPYSALANTFSLFGTFGRMPPNEAFGRARQLADDALSLDPELADAHAITGWIIANTDRDWKTADNAFGRAKKFDSNHSPAYFWHALTLAYRTRLDEAIDQIDTAVELDPLSIPANRLRIEIYSFAGRYQKVIDFGQRHLELAPGDSVAGTTVAAAYLRLSRPDKAREILERYMDRKEVHFTGSMAWAQKQLGMNDKLEANLEWLLEQRTTRFIPAYSVGILYAALERYEEAIAMFQESHDNNEPIIVILNRDELIEPIWNDPRMEQIYGDLGLPTPQPSEN
jgi:serine/threonine protein kinase/tetratricopeptide (TPR) repeat protein